jgi:hypothetical protein
MVSKIRPLAQYSLNRHNCLSTLFLRTTLRVRLENLLHGGPIFTSTSTLTPQLLDLMTKVHWIDCTWVLTYYDCVNTDYTSRG